MHDIASARDGAGAYGQLGEELVRLALPPLAGSAFLEIGCREGFFCGFAWFEGARKIIGVDADARCLAKARERFPGCAFTTPAGNLARLLTREGGFDVILCSELPASLDVASFLPLLMSGLKRKGTLLLRLPMTGRQGAEGLTLFQAACRSPGSQPADPAVAGALEPYVYKDMGESVFPAQDGAPTHILHVKNKAPYAILLMGDSGSGKTTVAKRLFAGLPVIHGDTLLTHIAELPPGSLKQSHPLLDEICAGPQNALPAGGIMIQIFNSAAGKQYARLVAEIAAGKDFVYEGVIHQNFRHVFVKQLEMLGYAVVTLDTPAPENAPRELFLKAREEERKYLLYLGSRGHCGA